MLFLFRGPSHVLPNTCLFSTFQHIPKISHQSVVLKIESDLAEENSTFCSAKIYCCFCKEDIKVRQYGRTKKDGSRGSERWVMSNLESHLRKSHIGGISSRRSSSESDLKKFLSTSSAKSDESDVIDLDSASGEELTRECPERILLDEKKSSTEKTQGAEVIKIKGTDTAQQPTNSR